MDSIFLWWRFTACALLTLSSASGAVWHVSESGLDGAAGTEAAPLRTVAHARSRSASGDSIRLARGSVFRESELSFTGSRTLEAYGDPELPAPVLSGSQVVTGWVPVAGSGGLWKAPFSAVVATGEPSVFVNGQRLTLARFPDAGWLRTRSGTDSSRIVDASPEALAGARPGRWNGAQVRWRKWSWWFETRPVLSDDGSGTLTLGGASSSDRTGIGGGYYIDNHREALDAPGEWFWDRAAGELLLYPPAEVDPGSMLVEVAVASRALTLSASTVRGLTIRHFTDVGVAVSSAGRIEDCVIEHVWGKAITGSWGAAGSVIRGNTIRDILNVGISWNENPSGAGGTVMEANQILRCGVVPGLGGSGSWHAAGVIISNAPSGTRGVRFQENRVISTGYAGIILGADGQTVQRNLFRDTMTTLNDGAAIYTNCNRSYIRENIILDTVGDLDSSHPWSPLGAGIWPEFLSNFHSSEIVRNTVYGSGGNGLFLPNNFTCLIEDNIFLSNLRAGITLGGHEPGRSDNRPNQEHILRNNLIGVGAVPWNSDRPGFTGPPWGFRANSALTYRVHSDRVLDFGTMSGTVFLTQDGTNLVTTTSNRELSIPGWQSESADWADPSPTVIQGAGYLFANDSSEVVEFPLPVGVEWTDLEGGSAGPSLTLPPWRSAVLLARGGVVPGLPGYQLYSEVAAPMSWESWIASFPLQGADAAPGADPDGDGWPNAFEFLFGTDPTRVDSQPGLGLGPDGASAELEVRLRRTLDPWQLALEGSSDLLNWTVEEWTSTEADAHPQFEVRKLRFGLTEPRFFRLRLSP